MISKRCLFETRELLTDFGITNYNIPELINTDNELERWRILLIKKHLERHNEKELKVKSIIYKARYGG